mmetsp:Transcript_58031/g.188890  ORF Transcript_58031/g.188890 Transcript_58031/m.188890 type:complete len:90 (+) Transcript_58031:2067-2336(+)
MMLELLCRPRFSNMVKPCNATASGIYGMICQDLYVEGLSRSQAGKAQRHRGRSKRGHWRDHSAHSKCRMLECEHNEEDSGELLFDPMDL